MVAHSAAFRERDPAWRNIARIVHHNEKTMKRRYEKALVNIYFHQLSLSSYFPCGREYRSNHEKSDIFQETCEQPRASTLGCRNLPSTKGRSTPSKAQNTLSALSLPRQAVAAYYLEQELNAAGKALHWLTTPSRDLSLVCEMAGFEVGCIFTKRDEFKAGKFQLLEPLIATHE